MVLNLIKKRPKIHRICVSSHILWQCWLWLIFHLWSVYTRMESMEKERSSSSFWNVNQKSVEVNKIKHCFSTDTRCVEKQGSRHDVVRTVCIPATIYPQKEPSHDEIHLGHTGLVCSTLTGHSELKKLVLFSEKPFLSYHWEGALQINLCAPCITVTGVRWLSNAFALTQIPMYGVSWKMLGKPRRWETLAWLAKFGRIRKSRS